MLYIDQSIIAIIMGHQVKINGSPLYILLISTIFTSFKNLSKITPTCFHDHKINIATLIYKSIKIVHFLVPDKNFRAIAQIVFLVGMSKNGKNFHQLLLIFSSILLQIIPNFIKM